MLGTHIAPSPVNQRVLLTQNRARLPGPLPWPSPIQQGGHHSLCAIRLATGTERTHPDPPNPFRLSH